ncbi:hypothetical protein [Lysinibacillus sp. TE18511]
MASKYSRYEYNKTTSISRGNIGDMIRAQEAFIDFWNGKVSSAGTKTKLAGIASSILEKVLIRQFIQLFQLFL